MVRNLSKNLSMIRKHRLDILILFVKRLSDQNVSYRNLMTMKEYLIRLLKKNLWKKNLMNLRNKM
ncbi:hypothetical protein BLA29_015201 [Euroglyphus maynei]|uniref:Uncharacterized protein n=1 Tax=Euroglyphus maynei TaxID=6958 RepID=A0A1Y3BEA8_EURMA|nr:hypothetical protein BLA29_015201 [Euroglyphus maynei]